MNNREASRENWNTTGSNGNPTTEGINSGSLQRIADASELMAKRHAELIEERDRYKRWYESEQATSRRLRFSMAGYRAWITILRKKLAEAGK